MAQPPHDRDRQPVRLALHQITGRGQLVRGGDHGRAQRIAVRVAAAPQIVQHPHPGRADRDIGQPVAPRPPEGVRDDDADIDAERVPQPLPDRPRRGVRVLGQQQDRPGGSVRGVDPGGGHDQALPVLHDPQRAAPRHHPYRLGVDRRLPVGGLDDPALRLGDDLRGDEQYVTVGETGLGGGDQLGEIVPGPHLGHPGQGPHPEGGRGVRSRAHARTSSASANACRAISAVAATSVIISGTERQGIPADSTSATAPASTVSTSQPSSSPEP